MRVSPNSDSLAGRSSNLGSLRIRSHAGASRSAGLGAPIRARSRRHSSGCQPSWARSAAATQAWIMSGRCTA